MPTLPQKFPDVKVLLALEPEELARHVLEAAMAQQQNGQVHLFNFLNGLFTHPGHPASFPDRSNERAITIAVAAAWNWLEVNGVLVSIGSHDWKVPTRRAEELLAEEDFDRFKRSRKLQKQSLHPRISEEVWGAFIRGQFDVAVFLAMKAVEVAVREAANAPAGLIGTQLMRSAFHETEGKLTDMDAETSERQARSHLFAGAIGAYKNAQSHRDVNLDDPEEAYELVMLANHLLRIVDQRRQASSPKQA